MFNICSFSAPSHHITPLILGYFYFKTLDLSPVSFRLRHNTLWICYLKLAVVRECRQTWQNLGKNTSRKLMSNPYRNVWWVWVAFHVCLVLLFFSASSGSMEWHCHLTMILVKINLMYTSTQREFHIICLYSTYVVDTLHL